MGLYPQNVGKLRLEVSKNALNARFLQRSILIPMILGTPNHNALAGRFANNRTARHVFHVKIRAIGVNDLPIQQPSNASMESPRKVECDPGYMPSNRLQEQPLTSRQYHTFEQNDDRFGCHPHPCHPQIRPSP